MGVEALTLDPAWVPSGCTFQKDGYVKHICRLERRRPGRASRYGRTTLRRSWKGPLPAAQAAPTLLRRALTPCSRARSGSGGRIGSGNSCFWSAGWSSKALDRLRDQGFEIAPPNDGVLAPPKPFKLWVVARW